MATKRIKPTRKYTEAEMLSIAEECREWLLAQVDHIFVDEFLFIHQKIQPNDYKWMLQNSEKFTEIINHCNQIEETKLKKYGSSDQLNASVVNKILVNKHNYL